ncbi:hypothetical protein ACHAQD_011364 [Fusarium lateritium]
MYAYNGLFVGCVAFGLSTVRFSFHSFLLQYATLLGIDVRLSARVVDYFEDSNKGGVVLDTGAKITADLVVAADGIGSRSGLIVEGERPGAHVVTGSSGDNVSWMLTHKDKDPDGKERAPASDPIEALQYVQGCVPWLSELIKATPEMGAVDYKLLWRDPYPTWASPHSRIIQIGDAAHAFLPTSASGATMAMEDAFSLAASFQLGGKGNWALAVKVLEAHFLCTSNPLKSGYNTY